MPLTIGRCGGADIDDVVRFLDEQWQRGHALVASRRLLDWQHRNADGSYAFVVARVDGELAGILGYICTRRYDPALAADNVVWLTTWKVRDDAGVSGLGLGLLQHLAATEPHVALGAVGLNPATRPIYQALGYAVGELQHYVMPNAAVGECSLASIADRRARGASTTTLTARRLSNAADFEPFVEAAVTVPRKTARYFHARYACHPLYTYAVTAVEDEGATVGLLATRVAEHEGRRALRIVDFAGAGDVVGRIGGVVQALVQESGAEYADAYNVGIDPAHLARAGFSRVDPEGREVVPDHFEPFERRNVRLWFALKGARAPVLFKGDGDQDRPSVVPHEAR